nr:PREDICTED: acyl-CoA Delta(11) desaturase-like [Linepithema humile]
MHEQMNYMSLVDCADSSSDRAVLSGSITTKNLHGDTCDIVECKQKTITEKKTHKMNIYNIRWFVTFYLGAMHVIALYGLITFNYFQNLKTILWSLILYDMGSISVTAGAHRLWSHRSYSANLPLRLILFIFYSSTAQISIFTWARVHRVHHRYVDTDLDPHNSRRGFFHCHIGWILKKLSPEIIQKLHEADVRDVMADPIVVFQNKYVTIITVIFSYILPTLVPVYFWNETWSRAFTSQVIRALLVIHGSFAINSFAHMWGAKPYDKNICPTENIGVSLVMAGEGFHNYHHVFPWDYRASEYGWYILNHSAFFIDVFAKIGWAYNLKRPSPKLIKRVAMDRGDGSHTKWDEVPPSCD